MDHITRKVLHQHPNLGIAFHYRLDGRWAAAEEMEHETRTWCLMYADDCAFFASSEADLQTLYTSLSEVFKAEGMLNSLSKTEASVYIAWINASEWLDPKNYHTDGTKVKKANAFKYLGQRKERKGARTEVNVRIGDAVSAWHL